jgi:hypothetical protein
MSRFFLILIFGATFIYDERYIMAAVDPLKKIEVIETNNSPDYLLVGDWISDFKDIRYLKKLKAYVEKNGFNGQSESETAFILLALKWVSNQWVHDGLNEPPKSFRALDILQHVHNKNERYRCVEYGLVLSEFLQSYGFVTRKVALRAKDVAYGGFGKGHVAMEVWVNDISKWVFLDPQFGAYVVKSGSDLPLNFFEIFEEKKASRWNELKIRFVSNSNPSMPKDPKEAEGGYKDFLKNYFGHMSISSSSENYISLLLESENLPLTFQGSISNNNLFTKTSTFLYPEMNRVSLLLTYRDDGPNFQKLIQKLKIETDADYLKNMVSFAAVPKFNVTIKSNSKSKNESYEVRFSKNGEWKSLKTNKFPWDATSTESFLEVRSVNTFDRRGPSTFVVLSYK